MKESKQKYYFSKILECLIESEKVTIDEIADKVKISEKTTRTKVQEINDYLEKENLGRIIKKPRVGIWLECNEEQLKSLKSLIITKDSLDSFQVSDDRLYSVLKYLFRHRSDGIITTAKIANSLFLSTPTILKVLKECEIWLKEYNIELKNTRNKGVIIIFDENGYRRAVQKVILHGNGTKNIDRNIMDILPNVRSDLVRKAILDTEREWQFEFVDESFYEILVYCCVAVSRGNKGKINIDKKDIISIEKYNEFNFAKSIFSHLSKFYNIQYSENEVCLLAIQLVCSKYLEDNKKDSYTSAVKENETMINNFTNELILMVSNIIGIDLTKDKILKDNLILHLQATLFRMKYSNLVENNMVYYIKKEYKDVFRATWSLSILFEKYFDFKITEDELGFICLYFQAALERNNNFVKILVVSNQSRSIAKLIIQRIEKYIKNVQEVKVVSEHDLKAIVLSDFDIVVSSIKLKTRRKSILYVDDLLQDDWTNDLVNLIAKKDFNKIKHLKNFSPECQKLFDPDLLFVKKEFDNKEALLQELSYKLYQKGYVQKKFYKTVIERENITTTEIGNQMALPHGDQNKVNEPKVAIAVLDKPILWDHEEVDIVFLLAIRMMSEDEIKQTQLFYKQFIALTSNEDNLKIIRNLKSEIDLYKYLIK